MDDNERLCRVRTEIGNQNSRTFPGLFKDYLHVFQESFFIDGNSPNTAYTQDFCPIQDRKRISLSGSLFLPDFSSAYCLCTLLSFFPFRFPLCNVSLPVAFDSYYLNQIEQNRIPWRHYR